MELEHNIAAFAAWLDERAELFYKRRRFTHSEVRRDMLKAEIAELEAIRDEFRRMVPQALPVDPAKPVSADAA